MNKLYVVKRRLTAKQAGLMNVFGTATNSNVK